MLRGGARVYEGLSDDRQNGVDAVGHLNVQNKLRILQDVDPEPERETGERPRWVRERERGGVHRLKSRSGYRTCASPVGLPDVDSLWVVDSMFLGHVVQKVKEKPHSDRRRTLCTEYRHKDVIYKLLQRPLMRDRIKVINDK